MAVRRPDKDQLSRAYTAAPAPDVCRDVQNLEETMRSRRHTVSEPLPIALATILLSVVMIVQPDAANSSVITQDFTFYTDNYYNAPVDPLNGELLITYNPSVNSDFILGSNTNISEVYVSSFFGDPRLKVEWSMNGAGVSAGFGDLIITNGFVTTFLLQWSPGFKYLDASYKYLGSGPWRPTNGRIEVTDVPTGVPEPASWALMLTGFFGTAAALRRRRSAVAA